MKMGEPKLIKEIEDLLLLIRAMTREEQEMVASSMRYSVMGVDARRTMTKEQIYRLRELRWAEIERRGAETRKRLLGFDDDET